MPTTCRPGCALLAVALLWPVPPAAGQPAGPVPPDRYLATVRYRIDGTRDQHVAYFRGMVAKLQQSGFAFDPPLQDLPVTASEDPTRDLLTGRVAGKDALTLLDVPHVAAVLLVPEGLAPPATPDQRLAVQLELASGFAPDRQRDLRDQVLTLLRQFGFDEAVGYEDRGYTGQPFTRLRGSIPAGELDTLLKDLRGQPTGWFAPQISPDDLPSPLRLVNPVLLVEILPDPSPVTPLAPPADRGAANFNKLGDDLWALVQGKQPVDVPLRVQLVLSFTPGPDDTLWPVLVRKAAPGLIIEGTLGNQVHGVFGQPYPDDQGQLKVPPQNVAGQLTALADLDIVSLVRTPPAPTPGMDPTVQFPTHNAAVLNQTGLVDFHEREFRGQSVRLAVVDGDFRGWQDYLSRGLLPRGTRLVDLTRERNRLLVPDPVAGDPAQVGRGTQMAYAAALAAPDADLTLVRVDPAAPYMLDLLLRYVSGAIHFSPSLGRRYDDLLVRKVDIENRRRALAVERRVVLESFADERGALDEYGLLGPAAVWVFAPRQWHFLRLAELERDQAELLAYETALAAMMRDVQSLKGIAVIASALEWPTGYAQGGRSALTQALDAALRPSAQALLRCEQRLPPSRRDAGVPPLWLQSAGNHAGQSWLGAVRDTDFDGALEFAGPSAELPRGSWTPELNFLAWRPYGGDPAAELPGDNTYRVSLQWTETHDPDYFLLAAGKDWYARPLAELRLVVLRQRDPAGKTLSRDDFEVVARSAPFARRLDSQPGSATYEISADWTPAQPGRYAVRLERQRPAEWLVVPDLATGGLRFARATDLVPTGIRPLGAPTLPDLERRSDLHARLFVEALAGPQAGLGRPQLADYFTGAGTVGVPADARSVVTLGAADVEEERPQPYNSPGPPANLLLFRTPQLLAYDGLGPAPVGTGPALGSALAAPFAAGTAATVLSTGVGRAELWRHWRAQDGKLLDVNYLKGRIPQ